MSGSLILVLGDQLCPDTAALRAGSPGTDTVLMAEVGEEATYVPHHKKKLAFVFSAMRHFAEELREHGWTVDYVALDDPDNSGSLVTEAERAVVRHGANALHMTEPGKIAWPGDSPTGTRMCRSTFTQTPGSCAPTPNSPNGPTVVSSFAWSSSIARCGARPAC